MHISTCVKSEHISYLGPYLVFLPASCTAFRILIHAMLPSIVRRVDRGHVLLSDGWFSGPVYPPHTPLRRSLQSKHLDDQAKQAVKDAAGSGVSIAF